MVFVRLVVQSQQKQDSAKTEKLRRHFPHLRELRVFVCGDVRGRITDRSSHLRVYGDDRSPQIVIKGHSAASKC